jgi:hypothetical protein
VVEVKGRQRERGMNAEAGNTIIVWWDGGAEKREK